MWVTLLELDLGTGVFAVELYWDLWGRAASGRSYKSVEVGVSACGARIG